jgi:hypothetical protein
VQTVVGDWNSNGRTKIGVYSNGFWFLDYDGDYVWDIAAGDKQMGWGGPGVEIVAGDWNGGGRMKLVWPGNLIYLKQWEMLPGVFDNETIRCQSSWYSDFSTTRRYVHPQADTVLAAMERARDATGGHKSGHSPESRKLAKRDQRPAVN